MGFKFLRKWYCRLFVCGAVILVANPAAAMVTVFNPEVRKAYELYQQGNVDAAIDIYTLSAYAGDVTAQYNLAVIYHDRPGELEQRESMFWLEAAADAGDEHAQFNLGMVYIRNENQVDHVDQAVSWLKLAAKSGSRQARYNLGYLSFSNLAANLSRIEGEKWLRSAAAAGDPRAAKLINLLTEGSAEGAPEMYGAIFKLKEQGSIGHYWIKHDGARIYAIPVAQQKPITILSRDTRVEVVKRQEGWLGVHLDSGFPAWVPSVQLNIEQGKAKVVSLQADLYLEPGDSQQLFKIGLVDSTVSLDVLEQEAGWIKVRAPSYFMVWIREADVEDTVPESVPGQEYASTELPDIADPGAQIVISEQPGQPAQPIQHRGSEDELQELTSWFTVYTGDSQQSTILGIVSKGRRVKVEERKAGFSRLTWSGGTEAWIYSKFLEVEGDSGKVTADGVRVRILPQTGSEAKVIGRVNRGQQYQVTASRQDWYRIVVSQNSEGWVEGL